VRCTLQILGSWYLSAVEAVYGKYGVHGRSYPLCVITALVQHNSSVSPLVLWHKMLFQATVAFFALSMQRNTFQEEHKRIYLGQ
jgi:hypothetical protein